MTRLEVNILYVGKTKEHFIIIQEERLKIILTPKQAKGLINMIKRRLETIDEDFD